MANQQPAEGATPGNGPFDDPAMAVRSQTTVVLVPPMEVVITIGTGEDDAPGGQPFAKRIAVVGAVGDEMFGMASVRGDARLQGRVDERDFRGRRRGNGDSQRITLTQRIPSMTARWPAHGRPPLRVRGSRGRSGSILAHCAPVTRTLRLATSATSGQCGTATREKVQVLSASVRRL